MTALFFFTKMFFELHETCAVRDDYGDTVVGNLLGYNLHILGMVLRQRDDVADMLRLHAQTLADAADLVMG